MKNKIIGIFVCMLLIATAVPGITAVSEMNKKVDTSSTFVEDSFVNQRNIDSIQPPELEWMTTFGGSEFDMFRGVQETDDGGFIVSGSTTRSNAILPWVLKLDSDGNEEWNWTIDQFSYNGSLYNISESYLSFIHNYDGEFIICTNTLIYDPDIEEEVWIGGLLGFDGMGNNEFFYPLFEPGEWAVFPNAMIEIDDGFIIIGEGYENDVLNAKAAIMKTDFAGTVLWKKFIDYDSGSDIAYGFCATSDNGYFIVGTVNYGTSNQDVWVIKTDSEGNKEWNKIFGGPNGDQSFSPFCFETDEGDYLLGAWSFNYIGAGSGDLWIIKTDADGNIVLNESYGGTGNDASWCMNEANDEGYVFLVTCDYSAFDHDIWVIKTDDEGNAFWTVKIEDPNFKEVGQKIRKTSDGGYIIVGRTGRFPQSSSDALIIKLGPEQPVEQPEIKVKRPKARRLYLFNLIGIPFPFTSKALIYSDVFTFKVKAEDASGIEKVEFFINGIVIGEVTESPYNYEWTGAEKGSYDLKIRVYNNYGGTAKKEVTINKLI